MTFSVSLDEWREGHRVFIRSRNRFAPLMPYFLCVLSLLFGFGFWLQPGIESGAITIGVLGGLIYDCVWIPRRNRKKFRRDCGGDWSAPITYEFSPAGFTVRSSNGESIVPWSSLSARLESRNVWVFVVPIGVARFPAWRDDRKSQLLFLPKRVTSSDEGAREWAVVDAHFARPASPPIASPGS